MSATGLQKNWTTVSFATTALNRVLSLGFNSVINAAPFYGDNNVYPVVRAKMQGDQTARMTTGDPGTLFGLEGTSGTLLATQPDALGATGGAINWSLTNATMVTCDDTGQWGNYATATATFVSTSTDGVTPPLSIASRT